MALVGNPRGTLQKEDRSVGCPFHSLLLENAYTFSKMQLNSMKLSDFPLSSKSRFLCTC